jgi:hypothetical protein
VMRVVPSDAFGAQTALVACHRWRSNVRRNRMREGAADRSQFEAAILA